MRERRKNNLNNFLLFDMDSTSAVAENRLWAPDFERLGPEEYVTAWRQCYCYNLPPPHHGNTAKYMEKQTAVICTSPASDGA